MGLLDKTNPTATRSSVMWWAIGTGLSTLLFIVVQLARTAVPLRYWPPILLVAAAVGGGIGALIEWQMDDGADDAKTPHAPGPSDLWDVELDQTPRPIDRAI